MPRSAVTLARTHAGEWRILSKPDVSLIEQAQAFRRMGGQRFHPEFAEVRYQETDGPARFLHFRTPKQEEAHQALRQEELRKAKEAGEAEAKKRADGVKGNSTVGASEQARVQAAKAEGSQASEGSEPAETEPSQETPPARAKGQARRTI